MREPQRWRELGVTLRELESCGKGYARRSSGSVGEEKILLVTSTCILGKQPHCSTDKQHKSFL